MDDTPVSGLRERRLAEVDAVVADAGRGRAPASVLGLLSVRLRRAHDRCDAVDATSWAGYVTDLDRGIDELHVELARAAERPAAGPTVDDVLLARSTDLELAAWRLAAPVGGPAADALTDAEAALARYRASLSAPDPAARAELESGLESAMARLRDRAPGAPPA